MKGKKCCTHSKFCVTKLDKTAFHCVYMCVNCQHFLFKKLKMDSIYVKWP